MKELHTAAANPFSALTGITQPLTADERRKQEEERLLVARIRAERWHGGQDQLA